MVKITMTLLQCKNLRRLVSRVSVHTRQTVATCIRT